MDEATCDQYVTFVNYYIHQVNLLRYLLGEPYQVTYADPAGVLLRRSEPERGSLHHRDDPVPHDPRLAGIGVGVLRARLYQVGPAGSPGEQPSRSGRVLPRSRRG